MKAATAGDAGMWVKTLVALAAALSVLAIVAAPASAGRRGLSGTMSVAGGALYAVSTAVTLNSAVSGVDQMRFQNVGSGWSSWEAYAPTKSWTLAAGDGQKTVTAQYRNGTGKALTLSDGIALDTTAPVTTATSNVLTPPFVDVALAPVDAVSGVAATSYRVDGGAWRGGTSLLLCPGHKRASLLAGPHTIDFYSVDAAGNVELTQSLVITL